MTEPSVVAEPQVLIRPYATEKWVNVTLGVWTFALCPTQRDADALLGLLRGTHAKCRHCADIGPLGEDHTCPCPDHDNDCTRHPAVARAVNKEVRTNV
jgi:hypothetical protein